MNEAYRFAKEEEWIDARIIGISDDFLRKIKGSNVKLVETKDNKIKFKYVGVISYKREILIVLPKYYDGLFNSKIECIVTLIKVFKKIPSSIIALNKDVLFISRDISKEYISEIAIADFIIKDFIINGFYTKTEELNKLNSGGNINWSETVNRIQPIISMGYPIYNDVYNIDIRDYRNDEVIRIYETVLKYCIAMYSELLDYKFNRMNIDDVYRQLKRLGSKGYILSIIQREMNNTYNEREISLLKMLYYFFEPNKSYSSNELSLFGTNSFDFIWEYVCSSVLGNQYDELYHVLPIPKWKGIGGKEVENKQNILKPDILRLFNGSLIIFDSKYYNIELTDDTVGNNPGINDILKQYAYELAFRKKGYNIDVVNALLYPKEMEELYRVFGTVKYELFDLPPIVNIYLSANAIWDMFIKNKRIDNNHLAELINCALSYRR